ncbi:MAG: hypothetical protein QOD86_1019 [Miltoncostaeaceae bacterium]|nr:hypothetical protein [Miltoncostaeaceae bacterium]
MRWASAVRPRPAKATWWIAPIRVVASMRQIASGQIGIAIVTRSPRPTPMARRAAAVRSTSARSAA